MRTAKQLLPALVASTALLTAGDQFHVQFGVISYARGPVLGQAWWTAPGFALAVAAIVAFAWRPAALVVPPTRRSIVSDGAWFFSSYATSGILGAHVWLVTALLTGAWLARVARRPDRRVVAGVSLLLAALGTAGEILLHATHVCAYAHREIVLVPLWLPALYLQGAPFALSVARWVRGPGEA